MQALKTFRHTINMAFLADTETSLSKLLPYLRDYDATAIMATAEKLVTAVRENKDRQSVIEAFLHEYPLDSNEGILLMSLAEALLRIPDADTRDLFLQEKISSGDWREHLRHGNSLLVNLSTRALQLTGKFEQHLLHSDQQWMSVFDGLLDHLGTPLIRSAIQRAMQMLAWQFVIAETIEQALALSKQHPAYRYSFDMLGEAALTAADAEQYFLTYLTAIKVLGLQAKDDDVFANPGISIKLSALSPRFEALQHQRAVTELSDKLLQLASAASTANISITVDAEETNRLDMSLDIFAAVFSNPQLHNWQGLGLAVQAYQKRALSVIDWLAALAKQQGRIIPLRLVKGAYWDSEIKSAQEQGLRDYPVFTQKAQTDVSYLACAQVLLTSRDAFYPQFATHNAHTLAAVHELGKGQSRYEFQRLHGMGEQLYTEIIAHRNWHVPCRIYAPVGHYHELLPYLVRRLLENGANTSFISQLENPNITIADVIADPVEKVRQPTHHSASNIVRPADLYGEQRRNSSGLNLSDLELLADLRQNLNNLADLEWQAYPLINGETGSGTPRRIVNPADHNSVTGNVVFADSTAIKLAISTAAKAYPDWRLTAVAKRASYLRTAADLLEQHRLEFVSLCCREGGRCIPDALAEVREAVDFCRYYAQSALSLFDQPLQLPGPTGEQNLLYQYGRGVFVCISPWNFPLAIFIGQITAALAAGNTVIAKPANQTPLTAMLAVQILHQAGIPNSVLHFLPGNGAEIGRQLLPAITVAGVAFTGSTQTAQLINRQLAEQHRAMVPLIAETGGQNVMIADSSALAEQVVQDAVQSAFNSAGQRCSALRVLFLQQEVAQRIINMLIGAMQELSIGDPGNYASDIGPVINQQAVAQLDRHIERMGQEATILYRMPLHAHLAQGSYFPPSLIELSMLSQLPEEIFGPILHIIRYRADQLGQVVDAVNVSGYGLTLGIHSRIEARIRTIQQRARVGNIYINRNMIGAVVGVQPFGGMGLSGTGPKAGGPDYLRRFAVEQTQTTNTAAIGGNAALLAENLR